MNKTSIIINDFQDFKSVFDEESMAPTVIGENQDNSAISD